IEAAGGWSTATTTSDYLAVTEQVPAHALELVLWLEAERMAGLADGITEHRLAGARDAVYGEWRAAYVDEPYALVTRELQQTLWNGKFAAQGLPVLGEGYAAHVATFEAVRRFARERLVPNNAVIVVAGRFDATKARGFVEHYFGWIPTRETVTGRGDLFVEPRPSAAEVTVKDAIAKVVVAARCEPGDAEIDVIAQVVAARSQRLVTAGLASEVSVDVVRRRAAEFRLQATPRAGVDPAGLATALRDVVATLHAQPPDVEELSRAIASADRDLLLAYENVAVRADLIATWSTIAVGTLVDKRARLQRVTPESVERTWQRWLRPPALVTVIGRPEGP
ncbi:MAG TPA: insulinase family protein, partial [Kofleriaceae bacterium]|nr:insulinase family protein [Kofleriaceae bacterium]